jgi:hypothetical protein
MKSQLIITFLTSTKLEKVIRVPLFEKPDDEKIRNFARKIIDCRLFNWEPATVKKAVVETWNKESETVI